MFINPISESIDYIGQSSRKVIDKMTRTPSNIKKGLGFAIKVIQSCEFYFNGSFFPEFKRSVKGLTQFINLYFLYQNIIYWIHPFSKDNLDTDQLRKALENALNVHFAKKQVVINAHDSDRVFKALKIEAEAGKKREARVALEVDKIFQSVMKQSVYARKQEVLDKIKLTFIEQAYTEEETETIVQAIRVTQKPRPIIEKLSKACFTLAGVGGSLLTLSNWNMVNLSRYATYAQEIGTESRLVNFLNNQGLSRLIQVVAGIGSLLLFGRESQKGLSTYITLRSTSTIEEKKEKQKDLKKSIFKLIVNGVSLAHTGASLFMKLSPAILIPVELVVAGIGLVYVLSEGD